LQELRFAAQIKALDGRRRAPPGLMKNGRTAAAAGQFFGDLLGGYVIDFGGVQ